MTDRRYSSGDRRSSKRVPLTAAVLQRGDDKLELAQTMNIAADGMTLRRVAESKPYVINDILELSFQLPGVEEILRLSAEVMFDRIADGQRMTGVRFVALTEAQRGQIVDYLASENQD